MLPADDVSYGFDNIAGVQRMSPTLMERYLAAAQKISSIAVGASARAATTDTFLVPPELRQDDRLEGLPFGTRGGTLLASTHFPRDGDLQRARAVDAIRRRQLRRDSGVRRAAAARAERRRRPGARLRAASGHAKEGGGYRARTAARSMPTGRFGFRQRRAANRRADVPQPDTRASGEPARAVREAGAWRAKRLLHDSEGRLSPQRRDQRAVRSARGRRHAEPPADFRVPSQKRRRRKRAKSAARRRFSRRWHDARSGGRSAIRTSQTLLSLL